MKVRYTSIAIMLVILTLFLNYCGKKGPLKLEKRIAPKQVENIAVTQIGETIRLKWEFPKRLTDNKTELDPTLINRIDIFYSDKHIGGGKFLKKSSLLRKLKMPDIAPYEELTPFMKKQRERLTSSQLKKNKKHAYYVEIPFTGKNLRGASHFFAIRYLYQKVKSPICDVQMLISQVAPTPVTDLKANQEKKLLKVTWSKPRQDISGAPLLNIGGYKVFRRVKPTNPEAGIAPDENFLLMGKVLNNYYIDNDTGIDGEFEYYVSVLINNRISSVPSPVLAVSITDQYPPEKPYNLITFKGRDHMFLSWKPVPDKDLSHYRVYRRTSGQQEFQLLEDNVTTIQYKDNAVQRDNLYFYAITAVDEKGNESDYSNIAKESY